MPSEQAADLAAIRAQVAEQSQAPGLTGDAPAQRPELAGELAAIIGMAAGALSPAFPSLSAIYTPDTTAAAGQAIAAVCNKHGWLAGGIGGKWAEELAAAAVLLPLAWATYNGVQGDIAERQRKTPQAKAAAIAAEPGQATVTMGAGIEPGIEVAAA